MPGAYGPIFVRCRTNIYYCPAQNIVVNIQVFIGTASEHTIQFQTKIRQKSDSIYYRSYCAVTNADMVPLFDHGPVMFYLTGFGTHDMIFIADK